MMPSSIKWLGIYGNGALAVLCGLLALGILIDGQFLVVLVPLAVCGLAIYNMRIVRWVMGLNSEEEWLQAEVRKAELRQHLAALGEFAHASDGEAAPAVAPGPPAPTKSSG